MGPARLTAKNMPLLVAAKTMPMKPVRMTRDTKRMRLSETIRGGAWERCDDLYSLPKRSMIWPFNWARQYWAFPS